MMMVMKMAKKNKKTDQYHDFSLTLLVPIIC